MKPQRKRQAIYAALCCAAAVGIGHVAQFGSDSDVAAQPPQPLLTAETGMIEAQSLLEAVRRTIEPEEQEALSAMPAAVTTNSAANATDPCGRALNTELRPGALVELALAASCDAGHVVTISHGGLTFEDVIGPDGMLSVAVPAIKPAAEFTVTFEDSASLTAFVMVPDAAHFDRVALQMEEAAALSVHALEFGARPGTSGHVSPQDPKAPMRAVRAFGGFLTQLGSPEAQRAEVYSFPSRTTRRDGVVRLHVEAQVTQANCGRSLNAEALQTRKGGGLRRIEVVVDMPGCEAVGDTLVLKNILQDLKIAAN